MRKRLLWTVLLLLTGLVLLVAGQALAKPEFSKDGITCTPCHTDGRKGEPKNAAPAPTAPAKGEQAAPAKSQPKAPVAPKSSQPAATAGGVQVNGKNLPGAAAVQSGGSVLVPLRPVGEALGLAVQWDQRSRTATAQKGSTRLAVQVNAREATVGGQKVTLEAAARVSGGRLLVPLSLLEKAFGVQARWDAGKKVASIGGSLAFAEYVGSETCAQCHAAIYNDFKVAGHSYKLRPAGEAKLSPLPVPKGYTWDDISYVIGGYKWKSRYIDKNGKIITRNADGPGKTQYNLVTGRWVDYEAGKDKPYDCGSCHTTGYQKEGNQDGLPGLIGTWAFPGIQCEECHGPGRQHVAAGGAKSAIKVDTSAALCGKCHIRGGADKIPAKGGFIEHHEQYNELLASPHKSLSCVNCHNPHKKAEFSVKATCESCHASTAAAFQGSQMQRVGVTCVSCHMPAATKSAEKLGAYNADVKTHLFRINTDPAASMFTQDGLFAREFVTLEFACLDCHRDKDKQWAATNAKDVHSLGK